MNIAWVADFSCISSLLLKIIMVFGRDFKASNLILIAIYFDLLINKE